MLQEQLPKLKKDIQTELTDKGLYDNFARQFLDHIETSSTLMAYCHKCKEVDKIDFAAFDGQMLMYCNNCGRDILNLETELYSFVHFNCIKKRGEKFV